MTGRLIIRWSPRRKVGWAPILHLVALSQQLLGAELQEIEMTRRTRMRLMHRRLFRPSRSGDDIALYLVNSPKEIAAVVAHPGFDDRAALRVLWIVDSFWTDRVPEELMSNFDLVIYMQEADTAYYDRVSNGRALFIGWGADVLGLGSGREVRPIDILRVGRQPLSWEDDRLSAEAARAHGLTFHGRPPEGISYAELMGYYAQARFVIAFSNVVAPAPYNHPTKAYFTGRWTDALANGAVVAGIAPHQDIGIAARLWDGALLEFDGVDLERNLAVLEEAAARWHPDIARRNHLNALMRLDWRWGLKRLADRLDLPCPALDRDLDRLRERAGQAEAET